MIKRLEDQAPPPGNYAYEYVRPRFTVSQNLSGPLYGLASAVRIAPATDGRTDRRTQRRFDTLTVDAARLIKALLPHDTPEVVANHRI